VIRLLRSEESDESGSVWLTDEQFAKLQPHLPTDTRVMPCVDDRRVISSIVHAIESVGRWIDAPACLCPAEATLQPLSAAGQHRHLERYIHCPGQCRRPTFPAAQRFLGRSCSSQCGGRKKGELNQAVGRSRGGRTTTIHALTDGMCRPVAFLLTGGNVADCEAGEVLIDRMPATSLLNAAKATTEMTFFAKVRQRSALVNIPPPKANRKWKSCFSPYLYHDRNAIKRMFCGLKDFRGIATRYDPLATNFLASVCIAATVTYRS
jgi:transposase